MTRCTSTATRRRVHCRVPPALGTDSSDSDIDYDFLNDWGPRFKMLARAVWLRPPGGAGVLGGTGLWAWEPDPCSSG